MILRVTLLAVDINFVNVRVLFHVPELRSQIFYSKHFYLVIICKF
jgi:hypothetical protein